MKIDLASSSIVELSSEIGDSLMGDRPAAWQSAFAAADDKGTKQALSGQLKEQVGNATATMARAANLLPKAYSDFNQATSEGFGRFIGFVGGWLSRA